MNRRVAVTGLGVVSPVGNNVESFWQSLCAGRSGISEIRFFPQEEKNCRIAGQCLDFDPLDPAYGLDPKELKAMDRFTQMGLIAAIQAWRQAGLEGNDSAETAAGGTYIGTGIGGIGAYEKEFANADERRMVDAFTVPKIMNNAAASCISMRLGLRGKNLTYNTACSSSAMAIGEAFQAIRRGDLDLAVSGGAEAPIAPKLLFTWNCMRVLSRNYAVPAAACRPFDAGRDGLVMSEGAAMLVLENMDRARARGAKILGEVLGFGCNSDAFNLTNPQAEGVADSMRLAIRDAGLDAGAIDYVNAHGTGTRTNDPIETLAIRHVFGERADRLPVSSTKSMLGHVMGASPALEAVACLLAIRDGILPPTINQTRPDPQCNLDYVPNVARKASITIAMSNAFAFGGNNGVLVLGPGR